MFLADCKASEVKRFIAEYLEKVLEPSGWQAIWRTDVFEVLVGVSALLLLRHLSPLYIIYLSNRLFEVSQRPGRTSCVANLGCSNLQFYHMVEEGKTLWPFIPFLPS